MSAVSAAGPPAEEAEGASTQPAVQRTAQRRRAAARVMRVDFFM